MKKYILTSLLCLLIPVIVYGAWTTASIQVGSGPSNGKILQTDGLNSSWVSTSTLNITTTESDPVWTSVSGNYSTTAQANKLYIGIGTTSVASIITLSNLSLPIGQVSGFTPTNYLLGSVYYATTTHQFISSLPALSILKSQVSDFGTYEAPLTFNYPLSRSTNAISTVATSSLNLTVGTFLSPNISQWTNNSNFIALTDLSATYPIIKTGGVFSSGLSTTTNNIWNGTNIFGNASTTNFGITGLATPAGTFLAANADGTIIATTTPSSSSSGSAFPFTPTTNYGINVNSTTTPLWLTNGLMASSTSHFVNASTTQLTISGSLFNINLNSSLSPGTSSNQLLALDSNSNVYSISTSTIALGTITSGTWNATAISTTKGGTGQDLSASTGLLSLNAGVVSAIATSTLNLDYYPSFSYATSTAWTGTTTIALAPAYVAETWSGVKCFTDTGTLNISFNDGTNRMNLLNASTTVGTFTLSTNNTFTADEKRYVDIGTPASSPTKISCSVKINR